MTLKTLAQLANQALADYPESANADLVIENKDTPHAYESRQVFGFPKGLKLSLGGPSDSHAVVIGFITAGKVYKPKRKRKGKQ